VNNRTYLRYKKDASEDYKSIISTNSLWSKLFFINMEVKYFFFSLINLKRIFILFGETLEETWTFRKYSFADCNHALIRMLRELCGNFLLYKTLDRVRYRTASISVKYRVTKTICREAELRKNRFKSQLQGRKNH